MPQRFDPTNIDILQGMVQTNVKDPKLASILSDMIDVLVNINNRVQKIEETHVINIRKELE